MEVMPKSRRFLSLYPKLSSLFQSYYNVDKCKGSSFLLRDIIEPISKEKIHNLIFASLTERIFQ